MHGTPATAQACSASASSLAFGTISSVGNATYTTTATIAVSCFSDGTARNVRIRPFIGGVSHGAVVGLDGRVDGGASATTRKMASGANRATYGLFRDAARTQGWYTSAGTTVAGSGNGSMQSIAVYGRVPAQSTPPNGTYADTVTVTLTY